MRTDVDMFSSGKFIYILSLKIASPLILFLFFLWNSLDLVSLSLFLKIYLFTFFFIFYFWLSWVFVAAHRLSLIAEWGLLFLPCAGSSLRWLLLLWNTGSRHMGFGSCGLHSCGSQALEVWASVVILRHVRSSCTKDWPCVPSLGGQIRNHWTTREVPYFLF